eukprot:5191919-Pyramimonas_sp.AAC.1
MGSIWNMSLWACPNELGSRLPPKMPAGNYVILMDSQSNKTKWTQDTAIGNKGDVGKLFCQRLQDCLRFPSPSFSSSPLPSHQDLYEDYLKRHRPVLMASLGTDARFDRTFTDEKDGPGGEFALQHCVESRP